MKRYVKSKTASSEERLSDLYMNSLDGSNGRSEDYRQGVVDTFQILFEEGILDPKYYDEWSHRAYHR